MKKYLEKTLVGGLLRFDSLDQAEKITGVSYKEDSATSMLGMALMLENNQTKNELLKLNDDTTMCTLLTDYLRIIKDEGFDIVSKVDFMDYDEDHCPESLYIAWHPDGILLCFDTYHTKDVNSGHIYYNWAPNLTDKEWFNYTSSGKLHKDKDVYIGSHDAREALRYHITMLREHGTFINPWIERPFLWLLHYADTKGEYDYEAINKARIDCLPDYVKQAISP